MSEQQKTYKVMKFFKEFRLSSLSVDNRMTVFVLTAIIFIAGLTSYTSMPKEAFPEIVTPEIYVGTPYPGNSPVDIERLITRPLEKEINGITGIDEINSTSVQGYSTIQVKFDFDVTPEDALRKVKDKVDIAKSDPDFPNDLPAEPNVFELNFSELVPILNVNLSGPFSIDQLNDYAEFLEEEIEALPQISDVEIRGVQDKEMKINIDLYKMESLDISFNDVANAIQSENVTISGGDLLVDEYRRNVRVLGEFESVQDVENVIVKQENLNIVYLRDIATVKFEGEDPISFAREYTEPVVMIDVMKRSGENLLIASSRINEIIADAQETFFPDNLVITITNDQSDQTRNQVNELENSIIFGIILVVLVLLFFLGIRNALFVGIAIPLSMLMSFFILGSFGVTLNTMVLFSLVLALGMLVDNGIVVVENIYRLMEEGYSPIQAAKAGVGEVAVPIIASTATTLAAFLPLALWPGLFGEFMKYLPITLMIVLGSSLFVALVINPVLTSVYMRVEEAQVNLKRLRLIGIILIGLGLLFVVMGASGPEWKGGMVTFGNLLILGGSMGFLNHYILTPSTRWFQNTAIPALERVYGGILRFALAGRRAYLFFFGTIFLLFFSFVLTGVFPPPIEFFPENQPNQAVIYIEKPIGTDISVTNELTKKVEAQVLETIKKYEETVEEDGVEVTRNWMVESVIAQVGEGTSDPNAGPSMAQTPNKAKITVQFVEFADRRGLQSSDLLKEIRANVSRYPGVQLTVDKDNQGPPAGAPINIELAGDDYYQLLAEAEKVRAYINEANIGGIEELKLDVESGKPEMPIIIDREKARRYNVSTYMIGDALRTSLFGKEISTYKDGEDDYDIVVRFDDRYRYDVEALMNQRITFRDQSNGRIQQVPISAVARAEKSSTFSSVKRKDLKRVITISSNVLEGYNATAVNNEIKARMANYSVPVENTLSFTGEQEEQAEQFAFLSRALMIAVFLIFLILVSQFNSAGQPFIILSAVVLSLIGVFLGIVIFRMNFVIMMTMIGIISLAGIVVNNAIVLIDYTKLIIARKKEELGVGATEYLPKEVLFESIVEGGKLRLRPVLLTAITTVLGLLPLATGMNINFYTLFSEYDPQIYFGGDNVIFWGPMSWTIIFGLTFATFLTLVIVPVMFYLQNRLLYRLYPNRIAKV
ncbi:efflux RND transporter permease subunit [Cryomorphaceae bacterium]|nr:efflux RND transporter permease subunit [Cryomorphaceae bacterium]